MTGEVARPVLEAQGLRRHYGTTLAVDDFSLTVGCGEVVVLVGPNGCGKTTSIEMALGFRSSEVGKSYILGLDPLNHRKDLAKVVGVQLQGSRLHHRVRVREQIECIGVAHGTRGAAFELAKEMGLGDALDSLSGSLSGGMQRRTLVVNALAGLPRLAVLDEPTSGVDPESRLQLWAVILGLVRDRGTAMLITSHDLVEAERYGDRVVMMRSGRIIANDAPATLLAKSGLTRVVAARGVRADLHTAEAKRLGGTVIVASEEELVVAFHDEAGASGFHSYLRDRNKLATVIERGPTLEDIYFQLAIRDGQEQGSDGTGRADDH